MRLTVLCGRGRSTNILLNWLKDNGFSDFDTIMENSVSRYRLLQYRWRRLGLFSTLGQLLFMALVLPFLRIGSANRQREVLSLYGLRDEDPQITNVYSVSDINGSEVIERLQSRQPNVVLVNGTRIIRKQILNAIEAPFVNIHAGITPKYRGVHGGYWALWNRDTDNFGATLHLVDSGVDSGPILAQERTKPEASDNFASYPLLQQAIGLKALQRSLEDLGGGKALLPVGKNTLIGQQWFHPTILQYALGRLRGVK